MTNERWTVASLLRATRELFAQKGVASPRLDAELLLGHVLGMERMQLYLAHDRPVDESERGALRELVKRRVRGEPVAYLLGTRGFWKGEFAVDARVLIPRPETEKLVEQVIEWVGSERDRAWRIVDVGTGSGALAVSLAMELPNATVVAIDVSTDALEVAMTNAVRNGVRDRVKLVRGDLLDPLLKAMSRVDIVVSNPPYVGDDDPGLEAGVRQWEPALALFGGRDGLDVIRRLLPQVAQLLEPNGLFLCEIGHQQGDAVAALACAAFESRSGEVTIERDYDGHDRVLRIGRAVVVQEPPTRVPRVALPTAAAAPVEEPILPVIDVRSR